ncbi:ABC transporter permease [Lunatibacter salilacus]|uniref:ABC transporter permease n=1 Tax=Lunatibacter salilacus TaxID=2483804 RepID=UPI00131C1D74|nr:ABC transporter permease [Lunatibacter salilacus]
MLKNYLLIAFRNIKRNPLRTFVHIFGLALGVAVCTVVFHVVYHENSFDTFHQDSDRIYQVNTTTSFLGEAATNGGVPVPLAQVIEDEVSGIEQKTFFYTLWDVNVRNPETDYWYPNHTQVTYADPALLQMFPREWLAGNPKTALQDLNQVVLTESVASKFFPEQSPNQIIGKFLEYFFLDTLTVQVAGVVADFEEKSDFVFTDFLSIGNFYQERNIDFYNVEQWDNVNSSSQLFLKLSEGKTPKDLTPDFERLIAKYLASEEGIATQFSLLPLSELHFNQNFDRPGASRVVLYGLIVIGGIILLLASLNFINLETAQSILRAKEVGIRKTLGSSRTQLIFQSITETGLLVVLSIGAGIAGCEFLTVYFHDFLPSDMVINYSSSESLMFVTGLFLILTIFSGIFPALLLSAYSPKKTLSRDLKVPQGFSFGYFIQRNLTVVQFAFSIAFVVAVLTVSSQVDFLTNKELGFDREQILYVRLPYSSVTPEGKRTLQTAINQQSFVQQSSFASDMLASSGIWTSIVEVRALSDKPQLSVQVKAIDENFMDLFGVEIVQGQNLSTHSKQLLINETLYQQLSNIQKTDIIGGILNYGEEEYEVAGVVPNVHTRTLRESILPMIFHYRPTNSNTLNVKVSKGKNLTIAKSELDAVLQTHFPLETEGFRFFDRELESFYATDLKLTKILSMASFMAIVISLLGLFALTSFTIAKKTKEISIRKVLGASVLQLLVGITKSYVILISMAVLLGIIPAWLLLDLWLSEFAYRIPMPFHLFAIAGIFLSLLALMIVSIHGLKVAHKNPSEVLKIE